VILITEEQVNTAGNMLERGAMIKIFGNETAAHQSFKTKTAELEKHATILSSV
jgi:hypothetical protein